MISRTARQLFLAAIVVTAASCSSGVVEVEGDTGAADESALALKLAEAAPELHAFLSANGSAWSREERTWVSQSASSGSDSDTLRTRLPTSARDRFEVAVGPFDGFRIGLELEGASNATSHSSLGFISYPEAFPSTDILWTATETRVEELLLLRDRAAPHVFSWRMDLPSGIGAVREEEGALMLDDELGRAVLRVPPPFALDARGDRYRADLRWQAYGSPSARTGSLVVSLPDQGFQYPILLDPALEVFRWVQRVPQTSPSARGGHAMVYDSQRGVTVLFGGLGNTAYKNDVWEWNGTNWALKPASVSPSARYGHAMAYDPVRQRTVLFGGSVGGSPNAETWTWDGANWEQKTPEDSPLARSGHAMAFSAVRGTVILFGGAHLNGANNETWEWDGTNWAQLFPLTRPPARIAHAIADDSARGRIVLYGGSPNSGPVLSDTWEWDGSDWTLKQQASAPGARHGLALAFDAPRARTVMFGSSYGILYDTWEWTGSTWTSRSTPRPSVGSRHGCDGVRRRSRPDGPLRRLGR